MTGREILELGLLAIKANQIIMKKKKRLWQRDWVARRGQIIPFFKEIEDEDPMKFLANFRMPIEVFEDLLERVTPLIQKQVDSYF